MRILTSCFSSLGRPTLKLQDFRGSETARTYAAAFRRFLVDFLWRRLQMHSQIGGLYDRAIRARIKVEWP
jgi:hypothetical protein